MRDIAERTGLPQPYLEQILLALKGAGLVRSKRGVGGGYVLARPPEEITLSQIVSAVDGPIVAGDFGLPHENGACDHEGSVCCSPCGPTSASTCAPISSRSTWPTWWPGPRGGSRPSARVPADGQLDPSLTSSGSTAGAARWCLPVEWRAQCRFHRVHHRVLPSQPSSQKAAGSQDQAPSHRGVEPDPAGGQDPQHVGVGHAGHVPAAPPGPGR